MSELYGWMGKILRVDLSSGKISIEDTTKYVPKFVGGKGIMHRIAWEEIPRGMGAFDPENPLMISVGPLTGTPAPCSGRGEVGGIAPQCIPEMYSHAGFGGYLAAELKYAGFDVVIIQGKSPYPCYLWITDNKAEIIEASDLWGLSTYATQHKLRSKHGKDSYSLVIGPAGENKSRIACMLTGSTSAAGQGGFGGLAGSKNLKAVCVKGTQSVKIAHPDELLKIRSDVAETRPYSKKPWQPGGENFRWDRPHVLDNVPHIVYRVSDGHSCIRNARQMCVDVPYVTRPGLHSNQVDCVGRLAWGFEAEGTGHDWPLWDKNFEKGCEASDYIQQYGFNEWEFIGGMVPWIVMAAHEGLFTEKDFGFPINPSDGEFWEKLTRMIAYREGLGDILAEGVTRAINTLGRAKYGDTIYTGQRAFEGKPMPTKIDLQEAWGYNSHWTGRGIHAGLKFPDWLLRALTWMTQTRDSNNDTHHKNSEDMEKFREDPYRGPLGPKMAIWDEHKSELKCALTLCDSAFPSTSMRDVEARLYSAVTGIDTTEEEMDKAGERLKNQVRAVLMRNNDRTRTQEVNEMVKYLKEPDGTTGTVVDEDEFAIMVDNYYALRGWDKTTGWPTRAKLEELGLKDVADELGAIGKLP